MIGACTRTELLRRKGFFRRDLWGAQLTPGGQLFSAELSARPSLLQLDRYRGPIG
jgi:hypothetical protein